MSQPSHNASNGGGLRDPRTIGKMTGGVMFLAALPIIAAGIAFLMGVLPMPGGRDDEVMYGALALGVGAIDLLLAALFYAGVITHTPRPRNR